jgi:hypothetical protein
MKSLPCSLSSGPFFPRDRQACEPSSHLDNGRELAWQLICLARKKIATSDEVATLDRTQLINRSNI